MKAGFGLKVLFIGGLGIFFLFASCAKQSLFTHRKYTGGIYYETLAGKNKTKAKPSAVNKSGEAQNVNNINFTLEERPVSAPLCASPLLPLCLKGRNIKKEIPLKSSVEKISFAKKTPPVIPQQNFPQKKNIQQKESKRISEDFAAVLRICMIVLAVIAVILLVVYVFFLSELVAATANLLKISLAVVLLLILA
ncbi:MAG: hypothetical protein IAF38_14815, partial [Bacteroidia bacterium]|nr:hypothetical protein [Bacteroidia bacterium]